MLDFFSGLITDGIWPVISALISFLPHVVILLTVVSLFKDSDFTLGFGCTTLAISSLEPTTPKKLLKQKIKFFTFIPCSAKLPVLVFLCTVILGWSVFGVVFLYLLSITIGLIFGGLSVVKLPRFNKITFKKLLISIFNNIFEFMKRITGGVLVAATILYTLEYFSILTKVTRLFEPFFIPLGLDNAMVIACLIFGLVAKEMIIGAVLSFGIASLELTAASSLSFILFVLLYTPCMPSLSAIRKKLGYTEAIKIALFNFTVAYFVSFVAFNLVAVLN